GQGRPAQEDDPGRRPVADHARDPDHEQREGEREGEKAERSGLEPEVVGEAGRDPQREQERGRRAVARRPGGVKRRDRERAGQGEGRAGPEDADLERAPATGPGTERTGGPVVENGDSEP